MHTGFPYHLLLFSRGSPEQPKGYISELFCWGEKPCSSPIPKGGSMVINSPMLLDYMQVKLKWFSVGAHTSSAERAWSDLIRF